MDAPGRPRQNRHRDSRAVRARGRKEERRKRSGRADEGAGGRGRRGSHATVCAGRFRTSRACRFPGGRQLRSRRTTRQGGRLREGGRRRERRAVSLGPSGSGIHLIGVEGEGDSVIAEPAGADREEGVPGLVMCQPVPEAACLGQAHPDNSANRPEEMGWNRARTASRVEEAEGERDPARAPRCAQDLRPPPS